MKSYKHFTINEREMLFKLLKNNLSLRQIAKLMGRSHSSISREVKRNTKTCNEYSPQKAQERYLWIRRITRTSKPLYYNKELVSLLRTCIMELFWSPKQISARLKLEGSKFKISYQTIYRYIYQGKLDVPKWWGQRVVVTYLRHKGKKHKKGKNKVNRIEITNHLKDRPVEAKERLELGHWEADTVIGKQGKACLVTLVDRKSRKVLIEKIKGKDATSVKNAIIELLQNEICKSITPDRGTEFAKHKEVSESLKVKFYFPEAYSPWQRPTNENTNGLIRQFIKKKTDISDIPEDRIYEIQELLNNRPREELLFLTPNEVHNSEFKKIITF